VYGCVVCEGCVWCICVSGVCVYACVQWCMSGVCMDVNSGLCGIYLLW